VPETYPRIQPPSTGAQVPAARPGSLPATPVGPVPEIEIPAPAVEETTPTAAELAYAEELAKLYEEAQAKRLAEAGAEPGEPPQQADETPTKPVNRNG
jgi:hypothetical protein